MHAWPASIPHRQHLAQARVGPAPLQTSRTASCNASIASLGRVRPCCPVQLRPPPRRALPNPAAPPLRLATLASPPLWCALMAQAIMPRMPCVVWEVVCSLVRSERWSGDGSARVPSGSPGGRYGACVQRAVHEACTILINPDLRSAIRSPALARLLRAVRSAWRAGRPGDVQFCRPLSLISTTPLQSVGGRRCRRGWCTCAGGRLLEHLGVTAYPYCC